MAKITPAMCHSLTTYYVKQYEAKYEHKPTVNRDAARWRFDSILQGLSVDETKELLDYYLSTASSNRHSLQWFFGHYDELIDAKAAADDDARRRAELRRASKQRAEEWLKRGNTRIATD
jgi:ABC-type oligopeptide transport system substrate-binding subunit